jgi:hypothetical protein
MVLCGAAVFCDTQELHAIAIVQWNITDTAIHWVRSVSRIYQVGSVDGLICSNNCAKHRFINNCNKFL